MFKRELKINLSKPSKKDKADASEESLSAEDYVNVTSDIVRGVTVGIAFVIADYMVIDTIRKIAINRLSK